MLEKILGGGYTPPANNTNSTQPAAPPPPPPSQPAPETAETDEEQATDDGTYSPVPANDDHGTRPQESTAAQPADRPAPAEPVTSDKNEPNAPVTGTPTQPKENEKPAEHAAAQQPVAPVPFRPAPAGDRPAQSSEPRNVIDETAAVAANGTLKNDHVARITSLIACYEKLLSEPVMQNTDEARTRAMELAQNRVLTSLIGSMSTSDARLTQLDDREDQPKRMSLITQYYAEAGR